MHDHYSNRARVAEFSSNTYWLFADNDRLVVVVKNGDDGTYNYIYTGLFLPYCNQSVTRTTEAISANATLIPVEPHVSRWMWSAPPGPEIGRSPGFWPDCCTDWDQRMR